MTGGRVATRSGMFSDTLLMTAVGKIADFLIGTPELAEDKKARERRLGYLEEVLTFEADEIFTQLEGANLLPADIDPRKLVGIFKAHGQDMTEKDNTSGIDLSTVRISPLDDRVICLIYAAKDGPTLIQLARRTSDVPNENMPGVELEGIFPEYKLVTLTKEKAIERDRDVLTAAIRNGAETRGIVLFSEILGARETEIGAVGPEGVLIPPAMIKELFVTADDPESVTDAVRMPGLTDIPGFTPGELLVFGSPKSWGDSIDGQDKEGLERIIENTVHSIISSAEKYHDLTGVWSPVAVLSFFTYRDGTPKSEVLYVKVLEEAIKRVKERVPELKVISDGSTQLDTALFKGIFLSKARDKGELDRKKLEGKEEELLPEAFPPKVFVFPHIHSFEQAKSFIEFCNLNKDAEKVPDDTGARYLRTLEAAARKKRPKIAMCEAYQPDVLKAIVRYLNKDIGEVVLVGDKKKISWTARAVIEEESSKKPGKRQLSDGEMYVLRRLKLFLDGDQDRMPGLELVNPRDDTPKIKKDLSRFAIQGARVMGGGMTPEKFMKWFIMKGKGKFLELNYAAGMVAVGDADCMVSGKDFLSGDVIRALMTIIGTSGDIKTTSAGYLMQSPFKKIGTDGRFLLADITTNICPDAEELTDIILGTAANVEDYIGKDVKVAFISEKTEISSKFNIALREAKARAASMGKKYIIDGPMTMKEALEDGYNAIIMKDLSAGNILYKAAQRIGGFEGLCLVTGGGAKPLNDLSRGADHNEIYNSMVVASYGVKERNTALILNSGSSSVKYGLYDIDTEEVIAEGIVSKIGEKGSPVKDHEQAINMITGELPVKKNEIKVIGHRVVHCGDVIKESVPVDEGNVVEVLKHYEKLAPLHNPPNRMGIEICQRLFPDAFQVAVPDTAFHSTLPPEAYHYALPRRYFEEYGIRRYGFHGTSHRYVSERASRMIARIAPEEQKIITIHLGNGSSMAAVKGGKSIETSMGVTPLEGLVMGTRPGDLDIGIVDIIAREEGRTTDEIMKILNKESGLKGLAGTNSMKDVIEMAENGDEWARLAIKVMVHRIVKYIGAYTDVLGGVDAIVFTGGIGENAERIQREVLSRILHKGIWLDEKGFRSKAKEKRLTKRYSAVEVFVIATREEYLIMKDSKKIYEDMLEKKKRDIMDVADDELLSITPYELNRKHIQRVIDYFDAMWDQRYVEGEKDDIERYRNIMHKFIIAHAIGSSYGSPEMAFLDKPVDNSYEVLMRYGLRIPTEIDLLLKDSAFREKGSAFKAIENSGLDGAAKDRMKKMYVHFNLADSMEFEADHLRAIAVPVIKGKKPRTPRMPENAIPFTENDLKAGTGDELSKYVSQALISAIDDRESELYGKLKAVSLRAAEPVILPGSRDNNEALYASIARDLVAGAMILSRKTSEKVVIGIDLGWIPGYKSGSFRQGAERSMVEAIDSMDDLMRTMRFDNVEIVIRGVNESVEAWAGKISKMSPSGDKDLSNMVILGSVEAVEYFDNEIMGDIDKVKRAFLAEVDPREIQKYFEAHPDDPGRMIDSEIMKMLSISVGMAAGKDMPLSPIIKRDRGYDREKRKVIFTPLPPMDELKYEVLEERNRARSRALKMA
ncbi:MAG: acetate/propionate family kinase [Candidatus Omnitrophica bacterium]|nr:acetate/propionate family kinase [Candidatus Omnitrophota bacterium]